MLAFCIGDEDTVRGFRLAGVSGEAVSTRLETAEAFARARGRPDCGLLLVSEAVGAALGPELEAFRATTDRPLVVELPGPGAPAGGRADLARLLRSLVGAGLRLEDEEP